MGWVTVINMDGYFNKDKVFDSAVVKGLTSKIPGSNLIHICACEMFS